MIGQKQSFLCDPSFQSNCQISDLFVTLSNLVQLQNNTDESKLGAKIECLFV